MDATASTKNRPPLGAGRARQMLAPLAITAILLAGAAIPTLHRSSQVLVLAAPLAALWRLGSRLRRWLAPDFEGLSGGVFTFVFAVAFAVLTATWLGHFGLLRPAAFLLAVAAGHLLALLLPQPAGESRVPAGIAEITLLHRLERALLVSAFVAVALAGIVDVRNSFYDPPGPHGFDDISYHLAAVATWARHGDLRMLRFAMGDPATSFYPVGGELISWVLLVPFRDSDFAARWSQIPFALFSFLAIAALARRLGLKDRYAALAVLAYAGIHQVFPLLANGAGNDHSTAFFTLAALDGSLAFAQRPRRGPALAAGVALGMLLGTKYIGVLFAPVVLAFGLLGLWLERRKGEPGEGRPTNLDLARWLGLLLLALALTGGYTYLRNAVSTGNPVFPAPVRILGVELFEGWKSAQVSARSGHADFAIEVWPFLTTRPELFGWVFPFTLLPAALLAPLLALARRRWREAALFTLPAVFFLQFLHQMHDHRDLRYFLPGIAIAALALAWLLGREGKVHAGLRLLVVGGLLGQVASRIGVGATSVLLWLLLALAVGVGWELALRRWPRSEARAPMTLVAPAWLERWKIAALTVFLLALPVLGRVVKRYQEVKLDRRPAERALELLAGSRGAPVAYAGFNQPYLYFGGRLQNDLQYVPRNRHIEAQYYDWRSDLAEPYATGGYRRWRANLEARGIALLVIVREGKPSPEQRWVRQHGEGFELAYDDGKVEIWRLVASSPAPL